MDINDDRRKKLEAGKEKLAAFRKKKAKVKKGVKDNADCLKSKDLVEPDKEDPPIPNVFNGQDVGHTPALEEFEDGKACGPSISTIPDTSNSSQLEQEPVEDRVCEKSYPIEDVPFQSEEAHFSPDNDLPGLEMALAQRDSLIQQLTSSLQANAAQQAEKEDLSTQVLGLAQQVTQLQAQLKETDQILQEQLQFHGISASALQSAKMQMLQLQSIVHAKDKELLLASKDLERNNDSLLHSKEENTKLYEKLAEKAEELNNLQSCYNESVKQERDELDKSNQIAELQRQWKEQENELKNCIDNQAKEIENWEKSDTKWKERESQLKDAYEQLTFRLQEEDERAGRLRDLETEIEELKKQNEQSQEEAANLKKENEEQNNIHKSCLSKLEELTDEYNKLSFTNSDMSSEFEVLKCKNIDLEQLLQHMNLENDSMKAELHKLTSMLACEQEKVESFNVHQVDLESKHNLDCDILNNKINELQRNLSHNEESLAAANDALREQQAALESLKEDILAKDSLLAMKSQELSDLTTDSSNLHAQLLSREEKIFELENLLSEKSSEETAFRNKVVDLSEDKLELEENVAKLTKEINELKNQCDEFSDQVVQQDENMSANHIRTIQMSQKEYDDLRIIDPMELIDAVSDISVNKEDELKNELERRDKSLEEEKEKSKMLQSELHTIDEDRATLKEIIESLNAEICTLKEDLEKERLQSSIMGEELSSYNSKLLDAENALQSNLSNKKQSEMNHRTEVEQLKSDKTGLENDLENFKATTNSLEEKLMLSSQDLQKVTAELSRTEESLVEKTKELDRFQAEIEQVRGKEKEYIESQEEMQGQLESTVSQWQKLQLIVQEKEIELQNLLEDLDEQKRICSTLKRNHNEELDSLNSNVEALKEAKISSEAFVQELEGKVSSLQSSLDAKEAEHLETISKFQSTDSSFQSLVQDLSDKEAELQSVSSEKEKIAAVMSDKLKEIENIEENLNEAKSRICHLSDALESSKAEIINLENHLGLEKNEKESALEQVNLKTQLLLDKETALLCQMENFESQLQEVTSENNDLKQRISSLESVCSEKDELLSEEQANRWTAENSLNVESQKQSTMHANLSLLSEDIKVKEELLIINSAALEEKVVELSQKDEYLSKCLKDLEDTQGDLKKAREDIKSLNTDLSIEKEEKESLENKLKSCETEIGEIVANRDDLELYAELLKDKSGKMESDVENLNSEAKELKVQVAQLTACNADKEKLITEQRDKEEMLMNQVDAERQQCVRLEGLLSSLSADLEEKERSLVEQGIALEERSSDLAQLGQDLEEREEKYREIEATERKLKSVVENFTLKENSLTSELTEWKVKADKYEQDITELTQENKELCENLAQVEQDVKKRDREVFDLTQEIEIIVKECNDLKAELQDKENKNLSLTEELCLMQTSLQASMVEKEMLKNNFDACLEEMQQKSSAQQADLSHCKSQMVEESRNRDQSQDEIKELYIQQLAQMEDKLLMMDSEKIKLEKEKEDWCVRLNAAKEDYEHQVSELELSAQDAKLEAMRMSDLLQKTNTDHDNELTDLKSLHELQTSELMENCLSLEKSMAELQKTMSDQANSMKHERNEMEQSFENLMSEMDERKRRADTDVARLKMHQEEMKKDHEKEIKALEKKYETQLFDLEDRCSILTSENERRKKSVMGMEGSFEEERLCFENKIESLENIRRDLEIKCSIQDDDIALLKEQANERHEEIEAVLKATKDKENELRSEISELREKLTAWKKDSNSSEESLRKEFEIKVEDLTAENRHLKSRLNVLEMNAEMYLETQSPMMEKEEGDVVNPKEDMKKQITALADENLSLKRRLLGQKSLEKKVRLLSGVEDICPPKTEEVNEDVLLPSQMTFVTSTPSKRDFSIEEPFSPTVEEVSLIEGFVSESDKRPGAVLRFEKMSSQKSGDTEPDFVAEEDDRFQPESIIEQAVEDFNKHGMKLNIHPIAENEVTDCFQPEISDQFFVEISDNNTNWPIDLSVGMSPTSKNAPQSYFGTKDNDEGECQSLQAESQVSERSHPTSETAVDNDPKEKTDELDKHLKQMKEDLEEKYVLTMRRQEREIILEYEDKQERMQKEIEQHFAHKEQSIRNDWEKKFAKALQKMKKDFEKKLRNQVHLERGSKSRLSKKDAENLVSSPEGEAMPDIEECSEELGDVVEQLSKENQELAEVRDLLLKQIQIAEARGLHHQVQHQLQSVLAGMDKKKVSVHEDSVTTPTNPVPLVEEFVTAESVRLSSADPAVADVDEDSSRTEISETSSVATERFLEELEDISQQSCQDLPLEWELTNTIAADQHVQEDGTEHQSIWEVFDSRCMRQDCQELDALRSQYESQLSLLQRQLEAERRQRTEQSGMDSSQGSYQQLMSSFRDKLDGDQKDILDQLVARLEDKHQNDVLMEVEAVKVTLEQVYRSKGLLEVSAVQAKHEEKMKEMKEIMEKVHKERINNLMAEQQKGTFDNSLTDKYNKLIQQISQALDDKILSESNQANPSNKAEEEHGANVNQSSLAHDIRQLLMNQQEEISSLRSQLLGEYEAVLQSRTVSMVEQTKEMSEMEQQLRELQLQYSEQVAAFQQMLASRDDEQKKLSEEERNRIEKEQAELKSHYEKKVQDMETSFEKEINLIKEKYENQISDLVHSRLGEGDINQSNATDADSENTDTPCSTTVAVRVKELEKELEDRNEQIQELKVCLNNNDCDVNKFKTRVEELEKELSDATVTCSKLEEIVEENKRVIVVLEQEKKESEKLYKDLLEKESPGSKSLAVKGSVSRESVNDSFSSAKEEMQDMPHSFGTPEDKKDEEHSDSIPFANDSSEFLCENNNNNNENDLKEGNENNNCFTPPSLEEQVSNLQEQVAGLNEQLQEVRSSEKRLQAQLEECQHKHSEMIEDLRQELEHEKQIEVETLQSEFKVQMDIELKRQAAEIKQTEEPSKAPTDPNAQNSQMSGVNLDDRHVSSLENAEDGILNSSSNNMFLETTKFDLQTVVLAEGCLQRGGDGEEENLSEATSGFSPVSSLDTPTMDTDLPSSDLEKDVVALKEGYEEKIAKLTSELDEVNEERRLTNATHQQRLTELENQLNETEARYDRLMEGVQNGDHPELNDLMKDKYDQELDLAKSLMQRDFDETLATEKKKFMEHHRKLMGDFMEDKGNHDEEAQRQHEQELESLRKSLASDFEIKVQAFEQEIERLNRDLDLLREATPRGSDEGSQFSTLPEIEEITLQLQHQVEDSRPSSTGNSTPLKSSGVSYEESEEDETEAEKNPTLQVRSFSDLVHAPSPTPSVMKEKEELELKVKQLESQVERLTSQLVEGQGSSPASPVHSVHDTTLRADDSALITMLQSDLDRISTERESVQNTNDRLLSLLSDTVKTYIGVEDSINRKLTQVVSGTPRSQGRDSRDGSRAGSVEPTSRQGAESHHSRQGSPAADFFKGASPDVDYSQDSHTLDNTSILSNATDEGLEISQRLAESIFVGPDLDAEGEEILIDARGRLTSAVSQLLELMEQSTIQLHEAKTTQEDLLTTLASRARDVESSQSRSFELTNQLTTEIEAKEYLGMELHKAEGLIAGYAADREVNEKQIQTLEEQREALIVELDSTRSRLEDFQRSQSEIEATREDLSHQQTLLRENVGQENQEGNGVAVRELPEAAPALLNEVSNLSQERRELAAQLQHQLNLSRTRLSEMEALAEEAERKHENVVEEKNRAMDDMRLQLDNVERQLRSSKAFVEELMVEREQEREEHQREIEKLKETIEGKDRSATSQQRMQREIADLTEQLQSRINTQASMHQRIVDLQKVLDDKELNTNDLKVWVSQLEGELDQKFSEEDVLKERISKLERQLTEKSETKEEEVQETQASVSPRSDTDIEEFTRETSSVQMTSRPSVISLEEELQRSKETKQELDQENNSLKQQMHDQMLQISGLKNQIDQMRHYAVADDSDAAQLRERLSQERDQMEKKEAELSEAERKIERLESLLHSKQLEAQDMSSRVSKILEMGEAQQENERLRTELQELRSQLTETSSSTHQLSLPASLLEEKNEEISELKTRLQAAEAEKARKSEPVSTEQERIEHLQQQLKERDDEISDLQDSIALARRGDTCLDMSLPLTEEAASLLNISMTGRTSIQQEFEDTMAQREGELQSLEEKVLGLKKDVEEKDAELGHIKEQLSQKVEEEEKVRGNLSDKEEEVEKLQQELHASIQEVEKLKSSLEELKNEKPNQTDQDKVVESLEENLQQKDSEIYQLSLEMQELKSQLEEAAEAAETLEKLLDEKDSELTQAQEERDEKKEQLHEKDHKLDQMLIQIESLQSEITALTSFQTELQKDFDTIQTMLDDKERELESLTQELTDTKSQQDVIHSMENDGEQLESRFKQSSDAVEAEKQKCNELGKLLSNEEEKTGNLKTEITQMTEEIESLKEKLVHAEQGMIENKSLISNKEEDIHLPNKEQEASDDKISYLEQMMKENEEKAVDEMKELIAECDKVKEECDERVKKLEEQLQVQAANFAAVRVATEKDGNLEHKAESSTLPNDDSLITGLQQQIKMLEEEKYASIESLKLQNKELEDYKIMQIQFEEMEEQLRYRQTVLLELQTENERLSSQSCNTTDFDDLRKQVDEKELQVNELEAQLRFRQSALLEIEAEKDSILEEQVKLRQKADEKEQELQDLQERYAKLKDGIEEEEVANLVEERSKLKQDVNEKEEELLKLHEKYASVKDGRNEEVDSLMEERSKLKQDVEEKGKELLELREIYVSLKDRNDEDVNSLVKEKDKLKEVVDEKEQELLELREKYANLKSGINEEVIHMEQEIQKSSQARVIKSLPTEENDERGSIDVEEKLLQMSVEMADMRNSLNDKETELSRRNHELEVRRNTINDLLEELETLQAERLLYESQDKELERLQSIVKESEDQAQLEALQAKKLKKPVTENNENLVESVEECEIEMQEVAISQVSFTQTSSAPPACSEKAEAETKDTLPPEGGLRDGLQKEIQEKENDIKALTTEIETMKSQLEEQDEVILSLKDKLEISTTSHKEQILSRDNQISDFQEMVRGLKPQSSVDRIHPSESALSPQTKQQISQLKSQLRKAHAALEEMQESGQPVADEPSTDEVDGRTPAHQEELEALRKMVQEQEDELTVFRTQPASSPKEAVVEEIIQAEKAATATSSRNMSKSLHSNEGDRIRQHVFNVSETGSRRSYGLDEMTFGSSLNMSDNIPPRIQGLLDRLHGLGEDLMSASDFEYLQRHLFQRPEEGSSTDNLAWSRERAALMDTIVAVKELLQQADRLAAKSVEELSGSGDWRGDLLDSLVRVFQNEKQVLNAEVGTCDGGHPEADIVTQLESRIHDLEKVHQQGLDEMLRADRQSLLDEVDDLHHRLLEAKAELQDTRNSLDQRIATLEEAKKKAEWQLQKQVQMLEYKIQQEGVIQEDLKKSLNLERQRVSELSSQSSHERSRTLELQSDLSSAQIQLSKVRDALEREQHRFNSVTMDWSFCIDALEEEQAKTSHLGELLDTTKKKMSNLKEELAHSEARYQQESDSDGVYLKELRQKLEKEQQKSYEHSQAEEQAKKQINHLSEKLDSLKKKLNLTKEDYEAKIEGLHRDWMEREVQERRDRESETVTKLTDLLDVERHSHQMALDSEKLTTRKLKDTLEEARSENDKLLHLCEEEKARADKLKRELDVNRTPNDMLRYLRTTEKEAKELQQKVHELETELSHVQDRAAALEAELSHSHQTNPHNGHAMEALSGDYHRDAISSLMSATVIDEELKVRLAQCCTRLQMIASKLKDMRGQTEEAGIDVDKDHDTRGDEDLSGLNLVMEELEKLKANIRLREENRQNVIEKERTRPEQLLHHNKQLAEHVTKLKREKYEMTAAMKKLEAKINRAPKEKASKVSLPQYTPDVTSDEEVVYDRTVWASEKLSLQMALDSAEHEIQRLRSELRRFSSLTKADGQQIKLDPDKTQRLYGKFLRAESFRKALIYQKKYLLLLLGGYRDTEQETLAILASMGSFPSPRSLEAHQAVTTRPLFAFRSAGRAVISIFRMKYLVRKWKRATRVGSPVMTGQITALHAYVPNSSSSYALPQNQEPQQSILQQLPCRTSLNHRSLNSSSSSSSAPSGVASTISSSRSDYVESLTNGGLSSMTYSNNNNTRSNNNNNISASGNHRSLAAVSSPQVPSHHHPHPHYHQQQQHQRPSTKYNTTPPTKDSSKHESNHRPARGNRDGVRRQVLQDVTTDSDSPTSQRGGSARSRALAAESDDENFMRYLENVQQKLSEGSSSSRRVSWR